VLATALFVTACGGGGEDAAPVPPGPPVTQSVDAAGGKVVFSASGIKTTLDIPAGALSAATSITVTPVAPLPGESARVSVTPSNLRFAQPATVQFELPAGRTPNKAAALVQRLNGRPLIRASTVDAAARTVKAQIDVLGQFNRSGALASARAHALAASAPDTPPDGTLSLQDVADIGTRVAEAQAELVNLQVDGEFDKAIVLKLTIAQLLQSSGLDGYTAQAEPWLASAKLSACAAFAQASQRAGAQVIGNLGDYELFARGVIYWEAISNALGGAPCPGPSADAVLQAKQTELARYMTDRVATPQPPAVFAPLAGEVSGDVELGRQATTLGVTSVETHTDSLFVQPVVMPLRDAAFATAGQSGDQQAYLPLLGALPDVSELQRDAQYANTSLTLVSKDASGAVIGTATLGRGSAPGAEVTAATVRADVAGTISVSGNVAVLHCPNAASERLQTQFEAINVDDLASNGDALLATGQTVTHGAAALLSSAGIVPANAARHRFTIRRASSSCATTFGLGDGTLATVTLDFTPLPGFDFTVTGGGGVRSTTDANTIDVTAVGPGTACETNVDNNVTSCVLDTVFTATFPRGGTVTATLNLDWLHGSAPGPSCNMLAAGVELYVGAKANGYSLAYSNCGVIRGNGLKRTFAVTAGQPFVIDVFSSMVTPGITGSGSIATLHFDPAP
jgi:hypothetical protein